MDEQQRMEILKREIFDSLMVGSIGKLLVRKGILSHDEVIAELRTARKVYENDEETATTRLFDVAIENAVHAVERWRST
jgi:hypothetical protein